MIFMFLQVLFIKWDQNHAALGKHENNYYTNVIKMTSNLKTDKKHRTYKDEKLAFQIIGRKCRLINQYLEKWWPCTNNAEIQFCTPPNNLLVTFRPIVFPFYIQKKLFK